VLEFNRLFGNQGLRDAGLKEGILEYLQQNTHPEGPDGPTGSPPLWPVAV
jgi:ribosomal protein S6--L-glutamate ligase